MAKVEKIPSPWDQVMEALMPLLMERMAGGSPPYPGRLAAGPGPMQNMASSLMYRQGMMPFGRAYGHMGYNPFAPGGGSPGMPRQAGAYPKYGGGAGLHPDREPTYWDYYLPRKADGSMG